MIDHLRELRRYTRESKAEAFRVGLAPEIVPALIGPAGSTLLELENETGRWFELEPIEGLAPTQLEILAEGTRAEIVREAPVAEGAELTVRIGEPHPFVETDAVAWLETGYAITVKGALPYVGKQQRVRIDRALRFSAEASLLDAEPAVPEAIDRESDLLEPSRRVGERLDVEGRMRGRRRRGTPRATTNGAHVDPMSIEEAIEGGAPDYGNDAPAPSETPAAARAQVDDDLDADTHDDDDSTATTSRSPRAPRTAPAIRRRHAVAVAAAGAAAAAVPPAPTRRPAMGPVDADAGPDDDADEPDARGRGRRSGRRRSGVARPGQPAPTGRHAAAGAAAVAAVAVAAGRRMARARTVATPPAGDAPSPGNVSSPVAERPRPAPRPRTPRPPRPIAPDVPENVAAPAPSAPPPADPKPAGADRYGPRRQALPAPPAIQLGLGILRRGGLRMRAAFSRHHSLQGSSPCTP